MSIPSVNFTILDGTQGVQSTGTRYVAVVGPTSTGTANTVTTAAQVRTLTTAYGVGPAVEQAAFMIERKGSRIVFVKADASVAGTAELISVPSGSGISEVTIHTGASPNDDRDIWIKVETGGTLGVAGITLRVSHDGGNNYGALVALGTGMYYAVPEIGTLQIDFAAGTLPSGGLIKIRCNAPTCNATDIGNALEALSRSSLTFDQITIAAPVDATVGAAIDVKLAAMFAAGKYRYWVGNTRMPHADETEAEYQTAMAAIRASYTSVYGCLCSGACTLTSSVSSRSYRRPASFVIAAEEGAAALSENTAAPARGALVGVLLRDVNGLPIHHDEYEDPGLDDQYFTTLRSLPTGGGVFITRPRIFAPEGSDFRLVPHRRVLNRACEVALGYFQMRLNQPLAIDPSTGKILETEAVSIETRATATLRGVLMARPDCSSVRCVVSRDDNILSTGTLSAEIRIVPLGYPEQISITVGYLNPAFRATA